METNLDMKWRYAPDEVMTLRAGMQPVQRALVFPPYQHPNNCPIKKEYTVLMLEAVTGESRYYGIVEGKINSELKMIVRGINSNDSVRMAWKPAIE